MARQSAIIVLSLAALSDLGGGARPSVEIYAGLAKNISLAQSKPRYTPIDINPDYESRPGSQGLGDCDIYKDTLPGDALRGGSHTVVMALWFDPEAATASDRQWIFNLGQEDSMAHHWLWNAQTQVNAVQFGTRGRVEGAGQIEVEGAGQIGSANISGAQTIATTFDSATKEYRLYVNGALSSTEVLDLDIESGAMLIGDVGQESPNDIDFKGCVRGVDVYRSALPTDRVADAASRLLASVPWTSSAPNMVCQDPMTCGTDEGSCRDFGCSGCSAGKCDTASEAQRCCAENLECSAIFGGGSHWWTLNAPCVEEENENNYAVFHRLGA